MLLHTCQKHFLNGVLNEESLPNVTQNDRTSLAVDIVAKSPKRKYCGIEVSFQVTTNSTIERKAGQAKARYHLLHKHQHFIAYVIDGAGNFDRQSALKTICQYSDCTVTMKNNELKKACEIFKIYRQINLSRTKYIMAHLSENTNRLKKVELTEFPKFSEKEPSIWFLNLPYFKNLKNTDKIIRHIYLLSENLNENSVFNYIYLSNFCK